MEAKIKFVPGSERVNATRLYPNAQVTVRIVTGFLCFETWKDFRTWKQNPNQRMEEART